MSRGRSVEFIGIGFQRCSSSWLHAALSEHPQIGKPARGLHFFSEDENYEKGESWYLDQFDRFSDRKALVELSVSYGYPEKFEKVIDRIKTVLPDVKIFCVVRNPIDRAYSEFRRSRQFAEAGAGGFMEVILDNEEYYLRRGLYGQVLAKYCEAFPGNVKVFFYDDLMKDPASYIKEIYGYLDIEAEFVPSVLTAPKGSALEVRSVNAQRLIRKIQRSASFGFRSNGMGFFLDMAKATGIPQLIVNANTRASRSELDGAAKAFLLDYYAEDLALLSSITGTDLSGWLR